MAEIPERKVLKDMLVKLKRKTLSSKAQFMESGIDVAKRIGNTWSEMTKLLKAEKIDRDVSGYLALVFRGLHSAVDLYIVNSKKILEDLELYIDTLECYSTELDKTLWDAIEQAKKEAEEQIKKQEELAKRRPAKYIE